MPETTTPRSIDQKEFEIPETLYVRDIEDRVFQAIAAQCVNKTEGVRLVEGNFLGNILHREKKEHLGGISVEQDSRNHSIAVRLEVDLEYGYSIPQKAEELQSAIAREITEISGLHVSSVHVLFKSIYHKD